MLGSPCRVIRNLTRPVPLAPHVPWADAEQTRLASMVRAHATPQALAFRGQRSLRAAAPAPPATRPGAQALHGHRPPVGRWRRRSLAQGLSGLPDAPRPGPPRCFAPRRPSGGAIAGHPATCPRPLPRHALEPRRRGHGPGPGATVADAATPILPQPVTPGKPAQREPEDLRQGEWALMASVVVATGPGGWHRGQTRTREACATPLATVVQPRPARQRYAWGVDNRHPPREPGGLPAGRPGVPGALGGAGPAPRGAAARVPERSNAEARLPLAPQTRRVAAARCTMVSRLRPAVAQARRLRCGP
jgi:hypothetical protein